jgi:2-methylaconitate cis-trans-isomerase PrpF
VTSLSAGEQVTVPAVLMRGGTSKALFFLTDDLPDDEADRAALLKRAMGTPHVMQIDGLGGGRGNTSKIAIVGRADRPGADVTYTFAQVGIGEDSIDFRATCGNISAAVGPFALLKGLVEPVEPVTRIAIYNSNINDILYQDIPVKDGQARTEGDFVNAGVPGKGAMIFTDFTNAVGRRTGSLLPTGHARDSLGLIAGGSIEATLVDAGNPVAYVDARALGLAGNESAATLSGDQELLSAVREIRRAAAEAMGLGGRFSVRVGLLSPPSAYETPAAAVIRREEMDLCARFFALDYCAPSYPGSASVSTGAVTRVPGSVAEDVLAGPVTSSTVRIGHPLGIMEVVSRSRPAPRAPWVVIEQLGFGRTARALMEGRVFIPQADYPLALRGQL